MNEKPTPPPEGELIRSALAQTGLSARKAAKKAGISEGRWRQIVNGYQVAAKGVYIPVVGSPERVAAMAKAVGVPPEDLAKAGRGDAAEKLAKLEGVAPLSASTEWWDGEIIGPDTPLYDDEILRWRDEPRGRWYQYTLSGIEHESMLDPDTPPEDAVPRLRALLAQRVHTVTGQLMGRPQEVTR
jgi:transcriptional regulator with XRE-family HTH domain